MIAAADAPLTSIHGFLDRLKTDGRPRTHSPAWMQMAGSYATTSLSFLYSCIAASFDRCPNTSLGFISAKAPLNGLSSSLMSPRRYGSAQWKPSCSHILDIADCLSHARPSFGALECLFAFLATGRLAWR